MAARHRPPKTINPEEQTAPFRQQIHVHTTSINCEVLKFQALKRYGAQISLDMTLEIRSKVIVGTDLKLWGMCKIVLKDMYTKFRDDPPIRSRVILGKPEGEGVASPPPPPSVPASVNIISMALHGKNRLLWKIWPSRNDLVQSKTFR